MFQPADFGAGLEPDPSLIVEVRTNGEVDSDIPSLGLFAGDDDLRADLNGRFLSRSRDDLRRAENVQKPFLTRFTDELREHGGGCHL